MEPTAWAVPARPGGPCVHMAHAGCRQARRSRVAAAARTPRRAGALQQLEVVVSVHNEATTLEQSIRALRHAVDKDLRVRTVVTIADSASTDGTGDVAQRLASTMPGVHALLLTRSDGAHALRMALAGSRAEVVACLDTSSPDLSARLGSVVGPVLAGHGELAVSTPALPGGIAPSRPRGVPARLRRGLGRLRWRRASDEGDGRATAIRRARALEILPLIAAGDRSLSAELVVAAARRGLRVTEIPAER